MVTGARALDRSCALRSTASLLSTTPAAQALVHCRPARAGFSTVLPPVLDTGKDVGELAAQAVLRLRAGRELVESEQRRTDDRRGARHVCRRIRCGFGEPPLDRAH